MAKEVEALIKLQIKAGAANPSPPVGPALGSKGVNIMDFCKQFNARTQDQAGKIIPVIIQVYGDKSFDFITKQPPVAIQLLEAAKLKSGSAEPNRKKVASLSWDKVKEIAEGKMSDLNAFEIEKTLLSFVSFDNNTKKLKDNIDIFMSFGDSLALARSMGITIDGEKPF